MKLVFTVPTIITFMLSSVQSPAQLLGRYASINGLKMYYEIHGEGFPLVLIHGGGSTIGTTFGRVLPALAKSNKVIAVEMQAHGHTDDIDRPMTFEQDADDIATLLKNLKIEKANIFGFSNGATTTLQLAIRHAHLVNRIVVASTMYKKTGAIPGFFDAMKNASFESMPNEYKQAFLKINPNQTALYRMYERDVTRMQNFSDISEKSIISIQAPTLIIAGNKDVLTPEHAVEMYRKIKNAQLVILPGGHGDYMGEITTLKENTSTFPVVQIIRDFLTENR
ncbi:MAG TPA: alpha/beta hydrolase [Chryseosolibacter sp.]